ncbi:MAG: NUDIX domain-containing protein, partial [Pseudomonadota bacterium]
PTCPLCPIRAGCRAFKKGVIHLFPAPKARSRPKDVFATAAVVRAEGKILLNRRASRGRFGGLWEFPTFERPDPWDSAEAAQEALKREFGLRCREGKPAGSFEHKLSHRTIHMSVVVHDLRKGPKTKKGTWVKIGDRRKLPFSRLQLRVAELTLPNC